MTGVGHSFEPKGSDRLNERSVPSVGGLEVVAGQQDVTSYTRRALSSYGKECPETNSADPEDPRSRGPGKA